jgi:hypothetical protein
MTPERWQHIDKLLGEALEIEASRRAIFLDQAGSDEELRRKMDALMKAHEQADSFDQTPAFAVSAQLLADESGSGDNSSTLLQE